MRHFSRGNFKKVNIYEKKCGILKRKVRNSIGKDLSVWVEKVFKTSMNPRTIESRAYRQKEAVTSNEVNGNNTQDNSGLDEKTAETQNINAEIVNV